MLRITLNFSKNILKVELLPYSLVIHTRIDDVYIFSRDNASLFYNFVCSCKLCCGVYLHCLIEKIHYCFL